MFGGNDKSCYDWAGLDSNQRRLTPMGLQPIPFSRSGTDPHFVSPVVLHARPAQFTVYRLLCKRNSLFVFSLQVRRRWMWQSRFEFCAMVLRFSFYLFTYFSNMAVLYNPADNRYDGSVGWYLPNILFCRCSSMVEHSFRKAGVEGPNPSIGCVDHCLDI